jgi:hypothetical protein
VEKQEERSVKSMDNNQGGNLKKKAASFYPPFSPAACEYFLNKQSTVFKNNYASRV